MPDSALPKRFSLIKYNHLVANCLIFHNVHALTRLLHQLAHEGHDIPDEALAHLSPYLTEHINRFGDCRLDLDRSTPLPDYTLNVRPLQLPFSGRSLPLRID